MSKGRLIVISGFSGSGKGTVVSELVKKYDYSLSISATTRAPREGEVDGREYYFKTDEEFKSLIDYNGLIEWAQYVDNYYGTPATPLIEKSNNGFDVLLDITIAGSLALKKKFPQAVTVFILPPSFAQLEERLKGRGTESEELVAKRLAKAREEVLSAEKFDYVVVNDDLQTAVDSIVSIMKAEKLRYDRQSGIEKTL